MVYGFDNIDSSESQRNRKSKEDIECLSNIIEHIGQCEQFSFEDLNSLGRYGRNRLKKLVDAGFIDKISSNKYEVSDSGARKVYFNEQEKESLFFDEP